VVLADTLQKDLLARITMKANRYLKGTHIGTAKIINSAAVRLPELERDSSCQSVAEKTDTRFDSPVRLRIISYRVRLTDADNCCAKYAIDGIVEAGILRDDSPKYVQSVEHSQVKVKNKSEERTVIEIEEVVP